MSKFIVRFVQSRCAGIHGFCRKLRSDSGNAVIELAIIMAFLGPPLLLGTADLAALIYGSIEVSNAAHAGVMYAMTDSNLASATAKIQTVAQNEASDFLTNLTVTPSIYYACATNQGGTQYSDSTTATAACTGTGNSGLEFVRVDVSAPVTLPFSCCGLPAAVTLKSSSVMEVE